MGILEVPAADTRPWPTLGPQVVEFLRERCVHGPGPRKGQPYDPDGQLVGLVYRMYEVYPRGHRWAGRRRFQRCGISLRKGVAKTELGSAVGYAELHPEAPVRCDGWRKVDGIWQPVGRPVPNPYIPMVAYTEEQTEDLAYAALYIMCGEGPDADLFDVGLDRILRLDRWGRGDGKAVALAAAPDSRDGALTTFAHRDETHRWRTPRLRDAAETMDNNLAKRAVDDPWSLSTTTTYAPGEGSVAQDDHEEAEQIAAGKLDEPSVFFFHREATPRDGEDLDDPQQLRAAIREASGPTVMGWDGAEAQVELIAGNYRRAKLRGNTAYFERVWLNRRVRAGRQAFDLARWRELAVAAYVLLKRDPVAGGFDGSRWQDSTGIVLTDLDGHQVAAAVWEHDGSDGWQVDDAEVDAKVEEIFDTWDVIRFYGDPAQGWDDHLARWAGRYGKKKVLAFYTDSRNLRRTCTAVAAYHSAIRAGEVTNDGSQTFTAHIGHARRRETNLRDEHGEPLWTIEKERHDSPFKIDLAMCGVLSWQARLDAIAADEMQRRSHTMVVMR